MNNIPENSTWEKNLLDRVHALSNETISNWCNIVTRMGLEKNMRDTWISILEGSITEIYGDLVRDAERHQNDLIDNIERLLRKAEQLCKKLSIQMPAYGSESLNLYQEQTLLYERIKEYEAQVEERMKEIRHLQIKEREFCKDLGRPVKTIPDSPLPNAQFISDFIVYLDQLESEKYEREEKFITLKEDIQKIARELRFKPSLDFEKIVLNLDDASFAVTDSNMRKLTQLHVDIRQQQQDVNEQIDELRQNIATLWKVLDEDVSLQSDFLNTYTDYNLDTLKALKGEIRRCQELKKTNIEKFVKRLREDLKVWWDKCHYTQKQRDAFEYFETDVYSEDLLALHELEIEKLQKFYNDYGEIIRLVEEREKLWKKMLDMEERACDPDRYRNRGGQLLKEEKERNALCKKIPEIEAHLQNLNQNYEYHYGVPFTSWGQTVEEIVQQAHEHREQNKKIKLSSRKLQRDKTPTPAKTFLGMSAAVSMQNLARLTPHVPSSKRKLLATPQTAVKKTRILTEVNDNKRVQTVPSKLRSNGKRVARLQNSAEKIKMKDKMRRISRRIFSKNNMETTTSTEYDAFEKEITLRKGFSSTIFTASSSTSNVVNLVVTPATPTPKKQRATPGSSRLRSPHTTPKLSTAPKMKLMI